MIRRLLTLLLLLPLSSNGMWMVCAEAEASVPAAAQTSSADTAQTAEAKPACGGSVMCPLHKPASEHAAAQASALESAPESKGNDQASTIATNSSSERTGAICLFSPDGASSSIAAVGFVYAPPAPVLAFEADEEIAATPIEFRSITYADAPSANTTPPPRA